MLAHVCQLDLILDPLFLDPLSASELTDPAAIGSVVNIDGSASESGESGNNGRGFSVSTDARAEHH